MKWRLKKKRIQNNDSEDDPPFQKNKEDARNIYQSSRRTKEETEMNSTLEGIIVPGVYSG